MHTFGSGGFRYEVVDNWAKKPRGWPYTDVVGVDVDSTDRVYVFTRGPHPVLVFDKEGAFLRSWGEGLFARPHALFIDQHDNVWCTDDYDGTVRKFDMQGNLLLTIGRSGSFTDTGYNGRDSSTVVRAGGPFNRPTKAVVAPSGDIFVSDGYGNCRVHRFNAQGELLLSWGEPGTGQGQFVLPHAVAINKDGQVFVADRGNDRIQVFDQNGRFIRMWGGLKVPMDMQFDDQGHIFVADGAHRLSIWDMDGRMLAQWGDEEGRSNEAGYFYVPHAIARDSRGVLYVGEVCDWNGYDRGARAVQKFVPAP